MAVDRRRSPFGAFFSLLWTLAFAGLAVGVFALWEIHRDGPLARDVVFVVERGDGVMEIGRTLEKEGVIRNAWVFRAAAELYTKPGGLKAGEYIAAPGEPLRSVLEKIESGRMRLFPITVAEGLTSDMILDIVKKSDVLTGEVTLSTLPEGSLLPETYMVMRGMDRTELLERMRADQQKVIDELWPKRAANLPIKTPEEAITLASVVEKETGIASERPRVAAVFVNRLRQGIPLQSDPTIIYGITKGRPLGRGIRKSELERRTAYNTYFIPALPPTPIANPGRDAIEAVLNPPTTNDLFFVADGTGGHVFAATVEEHNRNVANWREVEKQRAAAAATAPARP
ncbi:MAG: endolytic transglycosylase MltG [Alphaproteobacteria bacterium]|nr:endolytic transglycosylase MltG [Alphaproteobacteria bacterium]